MMTGQRSLSVFAAGFASFLIAGYLGFRLTTDGLRDRNENGPSPSDLRTAVELRRASNALVEIANRLDGLSIGSERKSKLLIGEQRTYPRMIEESQSVRERLIHGKVSHSLVADVLVTADRLASLIRTPENSALRKSVSRKLKLDAEAIERYIVRMGVSDEVPLAVELAL